MTTVEYHEDSHRLLAQFKCFLAAARSTNVLKKLAIVT